MLCAQHALNNLLQAAMFTANDLADIARELDQLEADELGLPQRGAQSNGLAGPSHNFDDSGFFSLGVMENALKVFGLRLVRGASQEMRDWHDKPESVADKGSHLEVDKAD